MRFRPGRIKAKRRYSVIQLSLTLQGQPKARQMLPMLWQLNKGSQVILSARAFQVLLVAGTLSTGCFAQKVSVGYDKSVDFSKYKTFTFPEPSTATGRPVLYMTIVSTIQSELEAKGLVSVEKDGELTVIANGGFNYGANSDAGFTSDSCANCKAPLRDPMEWTGKTAPPGSSGAGLPKGVLVLDLVDRATNKLVWAGTVREKLDPEKKQKSLEKAHAALKKLLSEFPPKNQ